MIKLFKSYNVKVFGVILENSPKNAIYTSPKNHKEISHTLGSKVWGMIREKIGYEKFCIINDEGWNELRREKMVIILRFVDKDGFIKERSFILYIDVTQ